MNSFVESDMAVHTLEQIVVPSRALGGAAPVSVLLPPDAGEGRRFPVVYLLHSLAADSTTWARGGRLQLRVADLPVIIVMPDGGRSFYINTTDGRRYEDYLAHDLIPAIDQRYPTLPSREGRGIGGPSMGGFGALMLALRHRELFAAAFSQSGALEAPRWVVDGPEGCVFGPPDSPLRAAYDLERLASEPGPLPALYFDCGLDDFLLEENRRFHRYLRLRDIPHVYREHLGEHAGSYWNDATPEALAFVLRHLSQPPLSLA